ncbi:hypothetical protein DFP94_102243 [Fontibacillus phaseoli]|uniref:N-acetylglutamate synthase n=1 Tax=Fontibacillus phaseoli TaxID=1416533 RepID=A0A369BIR7_9BACL|nr:n-acetylglutamate synthase [Fontibacillus phaseoli]RCX21490.1 hypothetical protein DFP94_102243 [Fontibacillus phaseoli]
MIINSINYNGRIFRTVNNTDNGEVNRETIFKYFQNDNTVWADYSGGGIISGHLIALVDTNGCLDMRYHHINDKNEIMTGVCKSKPEILEDGKIRMHEEWEWTCKDRSKGKSIVEEI